MLISINKFEVLPWIELSIMQDLFLMFKIIGSNEPQNIFYDDFNGCK